MEQFTEEELQQIGLEFKEKITIYQKRLDKLEKIRAEIEEKLKLADLHNKYMRKFIRKKGLWVQYNDYLNKQLNRRTMNDNFYLKGR